MQYYSIRTLQEKLKENGLMNSRPYLLKWEKEGKIVRPANSFRFHLTNNEEFSYQRQDIRIYTMEEIDMIVKQVEAFSGK